MSSFGIGRLYSAFSRKTRNISSWSGIFLPAPHHFTGDEMMRVGRTVSNVRSKFTSLLKILPISFSRSWKKSCSILIYRLIGLFIPLLSFAGQDKMNAILTFLSLVFNSAFWIYLNDMEKASSNTVPKIRAKWLKNSPKKVEEGITQVPSQN